MIDLTNRAAFVVGEPLLSRIAEYQQQGRLLMEESVKPFVAEFEAETCMAYDHQFSGFQMVGLVKESAPAGPWRKSRRYGCWVPYGSTKEAKELRKRIRAMRQERLLDFLDIKNSDAWEVEGGQRMLYPVMHKVGDTTFYLPNTKADPGDGYPGLSRVKLADYVAACERQEEAA